MTMKSLAEAAAEVLNKSRSEAGKMPMQKLDDVRGDEGLASKAGVVDLGGATYDNPSGGEVGKKASDARSAATPPGVQPDASTDEPMHKLDDAGDGRAEAAKVGKSKAGEVHTPDESDGAHAAKEGSYAHPTSEEVEVDEEAIEEARAERWENAKNKMKEISVKEDIDAMFSGESLSEEFKTKVSTVFEAAVIARAVMVAESLEEEILDAAQEALDDSRLEIEEQVDTYLNFVVENWVKENQVAIETGLRSEIVEDFINGLKNLFAEHYIDVPAEKVDVVEEQAQKIADLNNKVNEVLNANVELTKKLNESKKSEILSTVCEGLTATQAAKVKTLAEGVEFTTDGEYTGKLNVIRESYFSSGKKVKQDVPSVIQLTEEQEPVQIEETNSIMSHYVSAINRTQQ